MPKRKKQGFPEWSQDMHGHGSVKNDRSKKDIEIQGVKRMWNHCTEGWVHTGEAIDEVGCIHSIQGYDLNYAFVILGNDIGYDKTTGQIIIRPECYLIKMVK